VFSIDGLELERNLLGARGLAISALNTAGQPPACPE